MILSRPPIDPEELPALVGAGLSVKVFTIREFRPARRGLCVCGRPRGHGAMLNVHCENSEMLDLAQANLVAAGAPTRATTRTAAPRWPRWRPRAG